jgi:4-amino-4-deoxy-L-arabinose transferase-like glycosyltransferase
VKRRRRTDLLLLLSTLVFAFVGQYFFSQLRDRFWDGVLFYAVAIFCFIRLLIRQVPERPKPSQSFWKAIRDFLRNHPGRGWSLLIASIGTYTAIRLVEFERYTQALFFWVLGIAVSIASWAALQQEPLDPLEESPEEEVGEQASQKTPKNWDRWEFGVVAGCTLVGLLLRLIKVGTIPFVLSGDEASMGIEALHVLEGSLKNPFSTGWLSHPTLYFFLLAGSIALLGRTPWGLRLFSPFVGTATIPVLYLLARRLFGRRVAVIATGLMTVAHLHIHFSRLGINNVYDPLIGLLVVLFLVRGLREGRILDFALAGFTLGLGQYFYMGARLFPIMIAFYAVVWMLLRRPVWNHLWTPMAAMLSTFLTTLGPLLVFFARHPDDFLARLRMVGIVQSGWLAAEQEIAGKSALELLWLQLRKSFFAFNYMHDPTVWYGAKIPYLDFFSAILFVFGLVVLLRRWRHRGYLLVNVWFWLALVFGGMLIENPPSSARFVIFIPAVCLSAALGLEALLDVMPLSRDWVRRVLILSLIVVAILNVNYYYFSYTPAGLFGGLNTEVGTRVGEYLRDQEPGYKVYFFGPPRMWVGYATIPFLAPGMEGVDIEAPLMGPPTFVDPSRKAIFIFLPERQGELEWVKQAYPQGHRQEVYGRLSSELLFVVYSLSP